IGISEQAQCLRVCRRLLYERLGVIDLPGRGKPLQCGACKKLRGSLVPGNLGQIFVQDAFSLSKLSKRQFRGSLQIVPSQKFRKHGADSFEYSICRGVLLLLGELEPAEEVCHEIIWSGLENGIEILI